MAKAARGVVPHMLQSVNQQCFGAHHLAVVVSEPHHLRLNELFEAGTVSQAEMLVLVAHDPMEFGRELVKVLWLCVHGTLSRLFGILCTQPVPEERSLLGFAERP